MPCCERRLVRGARVRLGARLGELPGLELVARGARAPAHVRVWVAQQARDVCETDEEVTPTLSTYAPP